jgi:aspartyl-tRNA synthetase
MNSVEDLRAEISSRNHVGKAAIEDSFHKEEDLAEIRDKAVVSVHSKLSNIIEGRHINSHHVNNNIGKMKPKERVSSMGMKDINPKSMHPQAKNSFMNNSMLEATGANMLTMGAMRTATMTITGRVSHMATTMKS